jgi:3D (Asp-Asp-Asp) domain-containing protein
MGRRLLGAVFTIFTIMAVSGCAADDGDDAASAAGADLTSGSNGSTKSFVARGTGYFPDGSAMEGGFSDRKGAKLRTLQQYLAGSADYVSVAMDPNAFSYGQRLRIHELNDKYGKDIVFKVVDTGGAFMGKGTSRIDICTANSKAAGDSTINGTLHIDAIAANAPSTAPTPTLTAQPSTPTPPPVKSGGTGSSGSSSSGSSSGSSSSGGGSCSSDGACNPGNDGSGLICVSHQCVPGCHSDAQCPGVTSCQGGQCL